jgi:hypothetical protein
MPTKTGPVTGTTQGAAAISGEAKAAVRSVPEKASGARSKPAFQRFARAGLCGRAVIYLLLAYLAADIAIHHNSPAQPSGSGALTEIDRQPGGRALLGLLAVALAGYGAWRAVQVLGERGDEREMTSVVKRVGWAAVTMIYFGLCARAVSLAVGSSGSGGPGGGASSNPRPFVGVVLRWPGGPAWVGVTGAGIAIGGAAMVVWGLAHDYSKVLQTDRMSRRAFLASLATGIAGEVTRGLLVILVSVYLLSASVTDDPARAKSLGQALRSFDRLPAGPVLLLAAAAGLACFAAYSVFEAVYRDI